MTGVLTKGNFGPRHRDPQKEDDVKHKDKMATYKPKREAWNRSIPSSLQKEH